MRKQIKARAVPNENNTNYYHESHFGTSRLITSAMGYPIWQGTFLPDGQEWNPEITTQDPSLCSGFRLRTPASLTPAKRLKFTGKERDSEDSLDYFGARYYSSTMGRWMSPDWADKPEAVPYADLSDPQSLNLYGYVRNNPMSKADADGHACAEAISCSVEVGALAGTAVEPGGGTAVGATVGLIVGTIIDIGAGGYLLYKHFTKTDEIRVPSNPAKPGTLGQPDHQQTAADEAARIPNGAREVTIPTPGGKKNSRKADAAQVDASGNYVQGGEIIQVYRPTKTGKIPKRERDAAQDIQNATGVAPTMVPVRPLPQPVLPPIQPKPPTGT